MTRALKVYTDLDSLFDTERGLIQKKISTQFEHLPLVERITASDEYFRKYMLKKYVERRYRLFNQPELGITPTWFTEAYQNRSIDDFDYFYPTNVLKGMLPLIMGVESDARGGSDFDGVELVINTHPYFTDDLPVETKKLYCDELTKAVTAKTNNFVKSLQLISVDVEKETTLFYKPYDYVFKRDIMFGYKAFHESLPSQPIQKVKFVIPEIGFQLKDNIPVDISASINFFVHTMSMHVSLFPISKDLYECYL